MLLFNLSLDYHEYLTKFDLCTLQAFDSRVRDRYLYVSLLDRIRLYVQEDDWASDRFSCIGIFGPVNLIDKREEPISHLAPSIQSSCRQRAQSPCRQRSCISLRFLAFLLLTFCVQIIDRFKPL